jgi:hypothetical protein
MNDIGSERHDTDRARPQPEPGNAPQGEPGNAWPWPEAERPPRREEGTVSDPDRYAGRRTGAAGKPYPRGGVVSDPDR